MNSLVIDKTKDWTVEDFLTPRRNQNALPINQWRINYKSCTITFAPTSIKKAFQTN
jgi:hypothetical protein